MKRALTLFLLIIISYGTYSQGNFRFGLSFSPNLGWIKSNDNSIESGGSELGYGFGLDAEFGLGSGENYSILTGIGVQNLSGKLTANPIEMLNSNDTSFTNLSVDARYINIPLALKLRTNEIGYMTYFGKFGLSNGILIGGKSDMDGNTNKTYNKEMIPFRSALLIGFGVEYNLSGNTNLVAGIDFNNGFVGMFRDSKSGIKEKAINNCISLNVGIIF